MSCFSHATTQKKQVVAKGLEIVGTHIHVNQGRGRGQYKLATIVWLLKSFPNMCNLLNFNK